MRILLDECIPAGLGRELAGHEVHTTPRMGWGGLKNGALLSRAVEAGFDVFLTVDKKLPEQQKPSAHAIAVIVLRCRTNDISELRALVPDLLTRLATAAKGTALVIGA